MKSWFKYICLFAGCVLSLPSCTYDELIDADTTETSVELTLSYAQDPISRDVGSKNDESDYTTETQCALDLNDIFILAFKKTDNTTDELIGLVEDLTMVGNTIKGRMRPQPSAINVYFAVLANLTQNEIKDANGNVVTNMVTFLKGMIGQTSDAVYQKLIFNTNDGKWLDVYNETTKKWEPRIPMWGKTNVKQLDKGALINDGCDLYRAVAKVQIWVDNKKGLEGTDPNSNDDDFKITSIVVNNANSQGYCASLLTPNSSSAIQYENASVPNNVSTLETITYIPEDKDVEYEIDGEEKQSFNDARESYSDFIYLPEHEITGGDNDVTITVNFTYNGEERTGTLYFKDYQTGNPWDVIRNHSYVFNITGVNSAVDTESTLQYQVMNWTSVTNPNLTFGNDYGNVLGGESASPDPSNDNGNGTETGDAK